MVLRYVGIKSLGESDSFTVKRISEKVYPKLLRYMPDAELVLIIKKYEKTGNRQKFSVHSKLNNPKMKFKSESFDWDISKATHKALNKLQTEVKRKYED